jgi:hypothetical protein
MSDQSKVFVNNMGKGPRDNILKVHGRDQLFADIRMLVSFGDRGGESVEDRILRHSGTPRGRPGTVQQCAWSARLSARSSGVSLDSWREQKLVDPRGLVLHVHKNPLLLGTLPVALEGSLDVFILHLRRREKLIPPKIVLVYRARE